jgi:hypothetical protein
LALWGVPRRMILSYLDRLSKSVTACMGVFLSTAFIA